MAILLVTFFGMVSENVTGSSKVGGRRPTQCLGDKKGHTLTWSMTNLQPPITGLTKLCGT